VVLLRDLRATFSNTDTDRLSTASVLTNLKAMEESPWTTINRDGSALNPRGLAQRLRRYGIKSENMRDDTGKVIKGYLRAQFADAWTRYLTDDDPGGRKQDDGAPPASPHLWDDDPSWPPDLSATSATSATSHEEADR